MARQTDSEGIEIPSWGPASKLVAITPSDATDLTASDIRAIWVGTGGNLAVQGFNDSAAVTLTNVPDGTLLPLMVKKVMSTNTTASGIVGLT